MNFLIISSVAHSKHQNQFFGYAPYVREMNIWGKYASKLSIVAPLSNSKPSEIDFNYEHENINFVATKSFSLIGVFEVLNTILKLPAIVIKIFSQMSKADHIHLRCPGNMGLLGCFVQLFFPSKPKTAKYAGNWDLKSNKPFSYKLQQWILGNRFLTKNMSVLVYGDWPGSSKNIKPFFTATYSEKEIVEIPEKNVKNSINFMFVGMLVSGKNPLYAIQIVEALFQDGFNVSLNLFGDGVLKESLQNYIEKHHLGNIVTLKGNQNKDVLKKAYQESHFLLLPSESEGWPKAVAEAMFWGCVPLATNVSCVAAMLDFGNRGIILNKELVTDASKIAQIIENENHFLNMSSKAKKWSQYYTTEKFEQAIKKILS